MEKARLQYIFKEVVAKETDYRIGMSSPWIVEDKIYATDGHVLLMLESDAARNKAVVDNGARHPNAPAIIAGIEPDIERQYIRLEGLENLSQNIKLLDVILSPGVAMQVAKVLRLFGLDTVRLYKRNSMQLGFDIIDESGEVTGVLICIGLAKGSPFGSIIECSTEALEGYTCDDVKGKSIMAAYKKLEKKMEREYNKKNFRCYEVTLALYTTLCIKAHTYEEAKEIALREVDATSDFDESNPEVDHYEESCRYNVEDLYEHYYDENGEQNWED